MTTGSMVSVRPIQMEDAEPVGRFLHRHLNARVPAPSWRALMQPPWGNVGPNRGFQLVDPDDRIVGAYLAVYSTREDSALAVCNLAAFCVLEEHRAHSIRLMRALLRQRGLLFTDLSPSGNVPAINERLGFHRLDTATRLVANLPGVSRGSKVTESPAALEKMLVGRDAKVYRDHNRATAARHVLVQHDDGYAYLMYRRDRRKRLPFFASPLYVGGTPGVLESGWKGVASHLAGRGLPFTLAERRILGFTPGGPGQQLRRPRPKMYRAEADSAELNVDYLYSELTLLQW